MRVDRRLLGWGVFLITLGAVALGVDQGWLPRDIVGGIWSLWPLLLLGAGVAILFSRSAVAPVASILVAGTLGLMLGSALAGGLDGLPFNACTDEGRTRAFPEAGGELQDGGRLDIELGCGDLSVVVAEGSAWRLAGGATDGEPPALESSPDAVMIRSGNDRGGLDLFRGKETWRVELPTVRLDLDAAINAGRGTLDLAHATLGRLDVSANAGEVRVDLAQALEVAALAVEVNAGRATVMLPDHDLEGTLSVNAGAIALCVSGDAGLRISTSDNLTGSNNFERQGLTRTGDVWETPDFNEASVQIVLDADANAGGIELNPAEGCDA